MARDTHLAKRANREPVLFAAMRSSPPAVLLLSPLAQFPGLVLIGHHKGPDSKHAPLPAVQPVA
jgi:hypothetical protein